ncbi:MAG: hypothetical protein DRJ01_15930 [Bacteroidetes bacterium]|nr:MAG: hypothetical protein DRJ01_15930 [Bacteroidota bacterium]
MNKIKKKDIKEICNEIDLIIAGKDNRIDYKYIFLHLNDVLTKKISYGEIALICETIIKIAKTKNRIIRHLEKDFWSFINKIPFQIIMIQGLDISENEELLSNTDYDNTNKSILSKLIGLVQDIIELKDDNSKGSELRREGSLRILVEMINYYHIPIAKSLFVDSINSKNKKEQYAALEGLENYYDVSEDEIEDALVKILNDIKNETDDRTVASTCLQIQISAGIIDEMIAVCEIDDWKDEHYD